MFKTIRNIVAVIILVTALAPSIASAEKSPSAQVTNLTAYDLVAGQPGMAMLSGHGVIPVTTSGPTGTTTVNHTIKGTAVIPLTGLTVAGQYTISAGDKVSIFQVTPAAPILSVSGEHVFRMDELLQVTVKKSDKYGNPVSGKTSVTAKNAIFSCQPSNCVGSKITVSGRFVATGFQPVTFTDVATGQKTNLEVGVLYPKGQTTLGSNTAATLFSYPSALPHASDTDYLRIVDDNDILSGSGNSDDFLASFNLLDFLNSVNLKGDVTSTESTGSTESTISTLSTTPAESALSTTSTESTMSLTSAEDPQSFEITFVSETVEANIAQDIRVRRVDASENTIETYSGTIKFLLTPPGPLLPANFTFNPNEDKGEHIFELALILPVGDFILTVEDTQDPTLTGRLEFTSVEPTGADVAKTQLSLTVASPVANGTYSGTISVQGSANQPNVEITVKEGQTVLGTTPVDASKNFNIPVTVSTDGPHTLSIVAVYVPDGSISSTDVAVTTDTTPPVVTSTSVNPPSVRSGEMFSLTVVTEPNAEVTAFINNASYVFPPSVTGTFTLSAASPRDAGTYPVNLEVKDVYQNADNLQSVQTLTVTPPLPEIQNLIGIPEVEQITLQWSAVPNVEKYRVTFTHNGAPVEQTTAVANYTAAELTPNVDYTFAVVALDASGQIASKSRSTIALKALQAPPMSESPPVGGPEHGAATIVQEPVPPPRNVSSGPEVYLYIALSILFLNFYAKLRRGLQ